MLSLFCLFMSLSAVASREVDEDEIWRGERRNENAISRIER
jgi:hypothetical protein